MSDTQCGFCVSCERIYKFILLFILMIDSPGTVKARRYRNDSVIVTISNVDVKRLVQAIQNLNAHFFTFEIIANLKHKHGKDAYESFTN